MNMCKIHYITLYIEYSHQPYTTLNKSIQFSYGMILQIREGLEKSVEFSTPWSDPLTHPLGVEKNKILPKDYTTRLCVGGINKHSSAISDL